MKTYIKRKSLVLLLLLGSSVLLSPTIYAGCNVNNPRPCDDTEEGVTCSYLDYDCYADASYSFDWSVDGVDLGTWEFDFGNVEVSGDDFAGYVYQDPDNPSCTYFKLDTDKVIFSIDGFNYSVNNLSSGWCQYYYTSNVITCPVTAVDFSASLEGFDVDNTVSLSADLSVDTPPLSMGVYWTIGFKLSACGYSTKVSWDIPLTDGIFGMMETNLVSATNTALDCSPPS